MKTFEIEITRNNVTPAEFLRYVRNRVDAKGGAMIRSDLDAAYFAVGNDLNFDISHIPDDENGLIRERSVSRPYEMQTFCKWIDGTQYNEICEFSFDDEKRGHGYYYLINVCADDDTQPAQDAETETETETMTDAEWDAESDRVHAATSAWLEQIGAAADTQPAEENAGEGAQEEKSTMTPYEKAIAQNPDSKNAWRLPGYPGAVYTIRYGRPGHGATDTAHYRTESEYINHVEYCKRNGYEIHSATKTENGVSVDVPVETAQEKADRENHEHCKHIAQDIERIASGGIYTCPECGKMVTMTETEDADGFTVYQLSCGHTVEYEPDSVTFYEYFSDVYDIEYRIGSDREYRSVKLMVACGGPNIYIDTARRAVLLYWWMDYAEYPISSDACDEIDNVFSEIFEC